MDTYRTLKLAPKAHTHSILPSMLVHRGTDHSPPRPSAVYVMNHFSFLLWGIITDRGSLATCRRPQRNPMCFGSVAVFQEIDKYRQRYIEVQRERETDLYMDMFSISWVEALS